ncbi:MAG TPA: disulfide bond formation protein B [Bauldia sp.]
MLPRALRIPAFVFVVGLATILGAWSFQLIGGFVPCKLCLEERTPYYVGVPLALLALVAVLTHAPSWLVRVLLALVALAFLYDAYLGTYHAGAEWGWWPGPSDCGASGASAAASSADLLKQLENIRVVSCTTASWRFPEGWGLSLAGWNAAIAVILTATAAWGAARAPKPHAPTYGSSSVSQ